MKLQWQVIISEIPDFLNEGVVGLILSQLLLRDIDTGYH
jgi:hypothetical protein